MWQASLSHVAHQQYAPQCANHFMEYLLSSATQAPGARDAVPSGHVQELQGRVRQGHGDHGVALRHDAAAHQPRVCLERSETGWAKQVQPALPLVLENLTVAEVGVTVVRPGTWHVLRSNCRDH